MIDIITLHSIYNPGSALQAYALQKFLIESGHKTEIIDYRPYYSTLGKNKLKGMLRKVLFFTNEKELKKKYNSFIDEKMVLTRKCYRSYRALKNHPPLADYYVSGSDQLWNLNYDCGKDDAYYLCFADSGIKLAYSTSIGKKEVPENELNFICKRAKDYKLIALREKSNQLLLQEKLQRQVHWVCDPVFLLAKDKYTEMIKPCHDKKYAVVYLSAESELLDQCIRDVKDKTSLDVILIGGNRTRCECDKHIKNIGPEDFLSYLYYSEFIICSSFHATAFAHIFHKKFGVILPSGNGERMESLLELSGLDNRIIKTANNIKEIYADIDYESVDKKILPFVEGSKRILLGALINGDE